MEKIYNFIFPGDEIEIEVTEYNNNSFKGIKRISQIINEKENKILLKVSQVLFKFGCNKYIITFEVPDILEYIHLIILTIPIDKSQKRNSLIFKSVEVTYCKEYLVNSITIKNSSRSINYRNSYCKELCWVNKLKNYNSLLCSNCKLLDNKNNGFLIGDKISFKNIIGKSYTYNGIITGLCNNGSYGIYYERNTLFDRFNIENKLIDRLYGGYSERLCFEVIRDRNEIELKEENGISIIGNNNSCQECILQREYCNDCKCKKIKEFLKKLNIKYYE